MNATVIARKSAPLPIQEPAPSGLMAVGFGCFCFFLFAYHSRLFDVYLSFLHLPGVSLDIALVMAIFSGRLLWSLQTKTGLCMLGLTAWLFICIPFSTWRGGSLSVVGGDWLKSVAAFIIGTALVVTLNQARRALFVVAVGTAAGALLVTLKGHMDEGGGRLSMQGSRFENANEIAMMMALSLPLLWLLIADSRASPFRKLAGAGMAVAVLATLMRTGSRAGLLAFAVLMLSAFLRASITGKAKMMVLMLVMGTLFALVVPHSIMERYLTLFHAESQQAASRAEADQVGKAESSAAARWGKFILSLQLTVQHPIFGIGPGTFPAFVDAAARSEGYYSDWNGTHNSYTQISSEAGIPGLLFFLALLILPVRGLSRLRRRAGKLPSVAGQDIANTATALRDSFFAFMLCIWFDHVAYQLIMPVMAALAIALIRAGEVELPALEAATAPKIELVPHVCRSSAIE
jgi:hypothetical protein